MELDIIRRDLEKKKKRDGKYYNYRKEGYQAKEYRQPKKGEKVLEPKEVNVTRYNYEYKYIQQVEVYESDFNELDQEIMEYRTLAIGRYYTVIIKEDHSEYDTLLNEDEEFKPA